MSLIVPSSKTEAGQQHLAQFNNKKTTKNAQFEHRKIHRTSALLCSQDQSVSKKKQHGRSSPVDFHLRPKWSLMVPTSVLP
jgi:hypothetical protein